MILDKTGGGCKSQGHVINTWSGIINRANLGTEVMHEHNAHNFPLGLPALEVPAINGKPFLPIHKIFF